MRRSIWDAMFSATSCASSSGCLISWMEMRTRLPKRFSRSSRSWSTDDPPLPMTMPGLAVWMVTVSGAVDELVRHAAAHRPAPPVRRTLVDEQLLENEVVAVEVEVVLGVGRGGLDRLGHVACGVLRRELEVRERFGHFHALHGVGHQPRFARRAAYVPLNSTYFHRRHLLLQCRRLFGVGSMAAEMAGGRELAQPVADHVLADEDRHVLTTVMNANGVADHVGIDDRRACPGADHLLLARCIQLVDLGLQRVADERPFLSRSAHLVTCFVLSSHAAG